MGSHGGGQRWRSLWVMALGAAAALSGCGGGASPAYPSAAAQPAPTSTTPAATATWWRPAVDNTWQWQLRGTIDTSYAVDVYDIDLFDAPDAALAALKAKGRRVVCYFSAGSSEDWRSDFSQFLATDMGNALKGWPGERWLDTRSANVRRIMLARLDLAAKRGCDGVEPDNVDGYSNNPGFALDAGSQIDFNRFIADAAHARGLAIALKNDSAQLDVLGTAFDFAVNEQCHEFNECGAYAGFIAAGKPVFNAEYASSYVLNTAGARDALCLSARAARMHTLVLPLQLDNTSRFSCD